MKNYLTNKIVCVPARLSGQTAIAQGILQSSYLRQSNVYDLNNKITRHPLMKNLRQKGLLPFLVESRIYTTFYYFRVICLF